MNEKLKETIYRPDSEFLNPLALFRSMVSDLSDSRELAWRLFIRNVNAQYRQTILGYLWAFLPPLFTTAIWVFLNSQKIFNVENINMPYPVFVLTGTVLWQTFVDAINSPLKLVNESKAMLTKVNFPKEALIMASVADVIFNFMIRLLLLIIIYLYYSYPLASTLFLAPLGVISLIVLGTMIGLLLTPISILYNDINRGLLLVTQAWFFLTPIIYSVPKSFASYPWVNLNPVTPILVTTRDWITTGNATLVNEFMITTTFSVLFLLIGWLLYRLAMPHLVVRMSA